MNTKPITLALLLLASCQGTDHPSVPAAPQPYDPTTLRPSNNQALKHSNNQALKQSNNPPLLFNASVVADPQHTLRLVAPMGGRVEGLRLEVGDDVRPGQAVARLVGNEAAELNIQRRQAEAECRLAGREVGLRQSLYADGLVSEHELAEARERLSLAEAALAQLAAVPSGDIVCPRGGTVLQRPVVNGQYVQAGDLLMEVADLGVVWVMADVYEGDIGRVREGDSVSVATLAYPAERHRGVVDKVYSALDPDSKTVKLRVVLPNPDRHLLPGMFATVQID